MRNSTKLTAFLNAALMLTSIGVAQTTAPTASSAPSLQTKELASAPLKNPDEQQDDTPHTAPVFWITSVEVIRSTHAPQLDVVRVRGLVPTEGWEAAELVPITKGTPIDGVLDLALVAEAPSDNTDPTSFAEVDAVFAIEPGHPFKGVRVHGSANRVFLNTFPGYAASAAIPKDCVKCTGKLFVAKGQPAPAGRTPDSIIREEDMPRNLRVIRDSEGIGSIDSDPNRLTLMLNEKGEIIMATWD
jgi:hypothetical protein